MKRTTTALRRRATVSQLCDGPHLNRVVGELSANGFAVVALDAAALGLVHIRARRRYSTRT